MKSMSFQLSFSKPGLEKAGMPVKRTPFSITQKSSPSESFLRFGKTQVWRLRIETSANHRIAAAIVSVADCAVVGKVQPGIAKIFG